MSPLSDEQVDARVKAALDELPSASPALRARVLDSISSDGAPTRSSVRRPARYLARVVGVALAASVAAFAWLHLRPPHSASPSRASGVPGELIWMDEDDDVESAFASLADEDA